MNINQFLKFEKFVDSIVIGINLWLIPQISEHCPKNNPGRFIFKKVWLRRPGIESNLIPREGTVQAWITSMDDVKIRKGKLNGNTHLLSTSINRNSLFFKLEVGIINELNSKEGKSVYSYLQYHWWPIVLMVILLI